MIDIEWPPYIQIQLGQFFRNAVIKELTFDKNRSKRNISVCTSIELEENRPSIIVNKELFKMLAKANKKMINCSSYPMIVPPLPWLNKNGGAFLIRRENFIRQHLPKNYKRKYENTNERIHTVLESCNLLGATAWRINAKILETIDNIYANGGCENLEVPSSDDSKFAKTSPLFDSFASKKSYENYYWEKKKFDQNFSLKCDFNNKYLIACSLKDKKFWQPHNVDFRSRVYTLSPYLTHYGNDLSRGILLFDQAKALTTIGLQWLKIDLINKLELLKFDSALNKLNYFEWNIKDKINETAENPYLVFFLRLIDKAG